MLSKVVIIDRQVLLRELLTEKLLGDPVRCEVVGTSGNGADAVELCQKRHADLLLLEHCVRDVPCHQVIASLRRELPDTGIVLLACHPYVGLSAAMAAKPHGCVLKEEPWTVLREGIEAVLAGLTFLSPMARLCPPHASPQLTHRQEEILRLIASGLSTKEVAAG